MSTVFSAVPDACDGMTINDECPDCGEPLDYDADEDGRLTILTCLDGCGWSCKDDPDAN